MTFNSFSELKNYILTHSEVAVDKAKEQAAFIINHFLTTFYKEFTPSMYHRTEQLLNSLVKTDVKFVGNGWVAEVYFDASLMDHASVNEDTNLSEEQILSTAMIGSYPHGGYARATGNTQIWTESMKILSTEGIEILKQELIKSGIPVR